MVSDAANQRLIDNGAEEVQQAYRRLREQGGGISGRDVCANIPWDRELERETERWKTFVIVYTEEEQEAILPYLHAIGMIMQTNRTNPDRTVEQTEFFALMREYVWKEQDVLHQKIAEMRTKNSI